MPRTFTKNVSNYMSLGIGGVSANLSGKAAISLSAKIKIASFTTGGGDNNVIALVMNTTFAGAVLGLDGTAGGGVVHIRCTARSISTGTAQVKNGATALNLNQNYWFGAVIDIAGDTITVYVDGVSDGSSSVTFTQATWTYGTPSVPDVVGGYGAPPSTTAPQFNGVISEVAVWDAANTAPNFVSLATGTPASSVNATHLIEYLPIGGTTSPEPASTGANGTITGSLPGVFNTTSVIAMAHMRRRRV